MTSRMTQSPAMSAVVKSGRSRESATFFSVSFRIASFPSSRASSSALFDSASARKIVVLGETAPCDYAAGPGNTMSFAIDSISVASLKKHVVANIGMLTATLESAGAEVVAVNMVTQVTADASGAMVRAIFNPLE